MEQLREEIKEHYHELYENVEAYREQDEFHIQSNEIKNVTDKIISIEQELEGFHERIAKAKQMHDDLDWLLEELESFRPIKKKRAFRDAIFRRLIRRGEVHEDGRIVYDLCLESSGRGLLFNVKVKGFDLVTKNIIY